MTAHLNLIPPRHRRWQVIRVCGLQWAVVWTIAAVLGASLYVHRYHGLEMSEARLRARESQYSPLERLQTESRVTMAKIRQMKERETLTLALSEEQPVLPTLGVLSRAARECQGQICVQHMSLVHQRATSGGQGTSNSTRLLSLSGLSEDNLWVTSFIESLRASGLFDKIELKSAASAASGDSQRRSYFLECVY